jgi:hypothetical protein
MCVRSGAHLQMLGLLHGSLLENDHASAGHALSALVLRVGKAVLEQKGVGKAFDRTCLLGGIEVC